MMLKTEAVPVHSRQDFPRFHYGLRPLGSDFLIHVMPEAILLLCPFIPDEG
jgi:hypothetical protein